jgi:hypothetical protein
MRLLPIVFAVLALGVSACGAEEETTPTACLEGPGAFAAALESAPEPVTLDGSTAISDCLIEDQPTGDLQNVGEALTAVATRLNEAAIDDPAGPEATQLGYLVGAVEAGGADTDGVHTDLILRINSAARFTAGGELPPAEFERNFGAGYAAGQESG